MKKLFYVFLLMNSVIFSVADSLVDQLVDQSIVSFVHDKYPHLLTSEISDFIKKPSFKNRFKNIFQRLGASVSDELVNQGAHTTVELKTSDLLKDINLDQINKMARNINSEIIRTQEVESQNQAQNVYPGLNSQVSRLRKLFRLLLKMLQEETRSSGPIKEPVYRIDNNFYRWDEKSSSLEEIDGKVDTLSGLDRGDFL